MSDPPHEETKVCPFCAETIKRAAIVCRYCGRELTPLPQVDTPKPAKANAATPAVTLAVSKPSKRPNAVCLMFIAIPALFILLIVVVASVSSFLGVTPSTPVPRATERPTPTTAQIKETAIVISYDSLARETEKHIGKVVYFQGDVIQVMESSWSDSTDLRVQVTGGDVLYVHYSGPRILEGDTVDLYATVEGRTTYETVLGAQVTIPEVTALVLTVVKE